MEDDYPTADEMRQMCNQSSLDSFGDEEEAMRQSEREEAEHLQPQSPPPPPPPSPPLGFATPTPPNPEPSSPPTTAASEQTQQRGKQVTKDKEKATKKKKGGKPKKKKKKKRKKGGQRFLDLEGEVSDEASHDSEARDLALLEADEVITGAAWLAQVGDSDVEREAEAEYRDEELAYQISRKQSKAKRQQRRERKKLSEPDNSSSGNDGESRRGGAKRKCPSDKEAPEVGSQRKRRRIAEPVSESGEAVPEVDLTGTLEFVSVAGPRTQTPTHILLLAEDFVDNMSELSEEVRANAEERDDFFQRFEAAGEHVDAFDIGGGGGPADSDDSDDPDDPDDPPVFSDLCADANLVADTSHLFDRVSTIVSSYHEQDHSAMIMAFAALCIALEYNPNVEGTHALDPGSLWKLSSRLFPVDVAHDACVTLYESTRTWLEGIQMRVSDQENAWVIFHMKERFEALYMLRHWGVRHSSSEQFAVQARCIIGTGSLHPGHIETHFATMQCNEYVSELDAYHALVYQRFLNLELAFNESNTLIKAVYWIAGGCRHIVSYQPINTCIDTASSLMWLKNNHNSIFGEASESIRRLGWPTAKLRAFENLSEMSALKRYPDYDVVSIGAVMVSMETGFPTTCASANMYPYRHIAHNPHPDQWTPKNFPFHQWIYDSPLPAQLRKYCPGKYKVGAHQHNGPVGNKHDLKLADQLLIWNNIVQLLAVRPDYRHLHLMVTVQGPAGTGKSVDSSGPRDALSFRPFSLDSRGDPAFAFAGLEHMQCGNYWDECQGQATFSPNSLLKYIGGDATPVFSKFKHQAMAINYRPVMILIGNGLPIFQDYAKLKAEDKAIVQGAFARRTSYINYDNPVPIKDRDGQLETLIASEMADWTLLLIRLDAGLLTDVGRPNLEPQHVRQYTDEMMTETIRFITVFVDEFIVVDPHVRTLDGNAAAPRQRNQCRLLCLEAVVEAFSLFSDTKGELDDITRKSLCKALRMKGALPLHTLDREAMASTKSDSYPEGEPVAATGFSRNDNICSLALPANLSEHIEISYNINPGETLAKHNTPIPKRSYYWNASLVSKDKKPMYMHSVKDALIEEEVEEGKSYAPAHKKKNKFAGGDDGFNSVNGKPLHPLLLRNNYLNDRELNVYTRYVAMGRPPATEYARNNHKLIQDYIAESIAIEDFRFIQSEKQNNRYVEAKKQAASPVKRKKHIVGRFIATEGLDPRPTIDAPQMISDKRYDYYTSLEGAMPTMFKKNKLYFYFPHYSLHMLAQVMGCIKTHNGGVMQYVTTDHTKPHLCAIARLLWVKFTGFLYFIEIADVAWEDMELGTTCYNTTHVNVYRSKAFRDLVRSTKNFAHNAYALLRGTEKEVTHQFLPGF
jgi:hypothetical protein